MVRQVARIMCAAPECRPGGVASTRSGACQEDSLHPKLCTPAGAWSCGVCHKLSQWEVCQRSIDAAASSLPHKSTAGAHRFHLLHGLQ